PMNVQAFQSGQKYFMVFVDDYSCHWTIFPLTNKSQAPEAFYQYKAMMELQTGHKIKCLHDDKEGGLSSNEFNSKLQNWGITQRFTMRNEPHSNGVAERAIRSVSDTATAMLHESNLPSSFWAKAVSTARYLHNILQTSANHGLSPHQLIFGKK